MKIKLLVTKLESLTYRVTTERFQCHVQTLLIEFDSLVDVTYGEDDMIDFFDGEC